jgi:hypothetical protein
VIKIDFILIDFTEAMDLQLFHMLNVDMHQNSIHKKLTIIFLFSDIEADFKTQLLDLVPLILAPENLVIKEIHGCKITGKELVEYFKVGTIFFMSM